MAQDLKRITCDPACGFEVQSHDESEVMEMAKDHAIKKHNDNPTDEQVRAMMKSV